MIGNMSSSHKELVTILETQAFEKLQPFLHERAWKKMSVEERELFARLLVMHGTHLLSKGEQEGLQHFATASKVSEECTQILFSQARALSSHKDNIQCLLLAIETLEKVLKKEPHFFQASLLFAKVLSDVGRFEEDSLRFVAADEQFERAAALVSESTEAADLADLYWSWGTALSDLGKLSGEPHDFHRAIDKFRRGKAAGCESYRFFIDFGATLLDFARLIEGSSHLEEALQLFVEATTLAPDEFEGWLCQGYCLTEVIDRKRDRALMEQADHCFVRAAELAPSEAAVWLRWAMLDMAVGRATKNCDKLEESLEKFARALSLEPENPYILSRSGEAELILGSLKERFDHLESARVKILRSVEIQPDDPYLWYLYGSALSELGIYYHDEDFLQQATEKFRYGLTLSRKDPLLYYGLALAYYSLAELTDDQTTLEKAMRYCARVVEIKGDGYPQFWNDWGVVLLKLGEMTEEVSYVEMAIGKFERALKQPVDYIDLDDVDLEWVYNYGCAFDLLGELQDDPRCHEKAIQILSQIVQIDPTHTKARYNLALAFSHFGELSHDVDAYQKGVEHFQSLLETDAEDDMVHLDYGVLLVNLGLLVHDDNHPERSFALYREAENHFMQALMLGNLQAHYQLAGLYSINESVDLAMHHLERARFSDLLPGIDDLLHDEWLENVRSLPSFRAFIKAIALKRAADDK